MSADDVGGRVKSKAVSMRDVVVPGEEAPTVSPCAFDRLELLGDAGPVLRGLELRLLERVVVGHMRTKVGLGDAKVGV